MAEQFVRHAGNPILRADMWPYPVHSVFNAGAVQIGDETLLLCRVEDYRGLSHLCAARSPNGIDSWKIDEQPTLLPEPERFPEEVWGIEDPRITWLPERNKWCVVYTAFSAGGPLVSMALTEDFRRFERLGAVMPPDDKDAALFPERFGDGRWVMLHRPSAAMNFAGGMAHVWVSYSPDLRHWGDHQILLRARQGGWWDAGHIGLCPPPLATPRGWLLCYHGVRRTAAGAIYRLGLALLDPDNPSKILRRSDEWAFGPREVYEMQGDVGVVVFSCGWVLVGDSLRLYYGGADSNLNVATASLSKTLDWLDTQTENGTFLEHMQTVNSQHS